MRYIHQEELDSLKPIRLPKHVTMSERESPDVRAKVHRLMDAAADQQSVADTMNRIRAEWEAPLRDRLADQVNTIAAQQATISRLEGELAEANRQVALDSIVFDAVRNENATLRKELAEARKQINDTMDVKLNGWEYYARPNLAAERQEENDE